MKTMSAREAKNGFGLIIDTVRSEPALIEEHGRGVVMVFAMEEYERLRKGFPCERNAAEGTAEATKA